MSRLKTVRYIFGYDEYGKPIRVDNINNVKGIYAIGLDDPVSEEKTLVHAKVGLGGLTQLNEGGLLPRIRSYYTCFPDGVWEYAFLISTRKQPPKGFLAEIEHEVHQELDKRNFRYKTKYLTWSKRPPELFVCSIEDLRRIFLLVKQRHPKHLQVVYPSEFEQPL